MYLPLAVDGFALTTASINARMMAALWAGKLTGSLSRGLRRGGGTTLPGDVSRWVDPRILTTLARSLGFKVVSHTCYLSPLTLKAWDIGLRPLSPVLIKMVNKLTSADRLAIKAEWMNTVRPFLAELYELDRKSTEQGGYHFVCLEKV